MWRRDHKDASAQEILNQRDVIDKKVFGNSTGDKPH